MPSFTISLKKSGGLTAYAKRRLKRLEGGKTLISQFKAAKTQRGRGKIARSAVAARRRKRALGLK